MATMEKRVSKSEEASRELARKARAAESTSAKRAKDTQPPLAAAARKASTATEQELKDTKIIGATGGTKPKPRPSDTLKLGPYEKGICLLAHNLRQRMKDAFARAMNNTMTLQQYEVLKAIAHNGGQTQISYGEIIGMDRSTTADVVRKLGPSGEGYIAREDDVRDNRAFCLWLTEKGATAYMAADSVMEEIVESLLDIHGANNAISWIEKASAALSGTDDDRGTHAKNQKSAPASSKHGSGIDKLSKKQAKGSAAEV